MLRRVCFLCVAVLLAAAFLFGCKAETPPFFLNNEEIPVKAAEPLELGDVRLVLPSDSLTGREGDSAVDERLTTMVEQRIRTERNIGMDLRVCPTSGSPRAHPPTCCTPPALGCRYPADSGTARHSRGRSPRQTHWGW